MVRQALTCLTIHETPSSTRYPEPQWMTHSRVKERAFIDTKEFDFPGFEGHTERFGPHPFRWKTPTPPENIRTQKFRFRFLFRA